MNIYFYDNDSIITLNLPMKKIGNFWLTNSEGKNMVNIVGEEGKWILSGGEKVNVLGNLENGKVVLKPQKYYVISCENTRYLFFCNESNDTTYKVYDIMENITLKFGKTSECDIFTNNPYILNDHMELTFLGSNYKLVKKDNAVIYINNKIMTNKEEIINYGTVIEVYGIKFLVTNGKIFINNPFGDIKVNAKLTQCDLIVNDEITSEEVPDVSMYKDDDYFLKSPRMRKTIETFNLKIDQPPNKENLAETPFWVTLAPMLTMAASSMMTLSTSIMAVMDGEKTLRQITPSLIICSTMIFSMMIWPFITKRYEKNKKTAREKERIDRYKQYLGIKRDEIYKSLDYQSRVLEENLLPTNVCYDMILNKRRTLWERRIDQADFLTVRVGSGEIPFNANIGYHAEDFIMEADELKNAINNLIQSTSSLKNVPIGHSFAENNLTAINGIFPKYITFAKNMLLQLMAYHSYDDLKIAIFTNNKNSSRWSFIKESPYCFTLDKTIRFFATNTEEMQEISDYLEVILNNRITLTHNLGGSDKANHFMDFNDYYLIIVDDINLARKISIIDDILNLKENLGFSLVVIEERLSKIPSKINKFITIGESQSVIINSENNDQIRFSDEISDEFDMNMCSKILSNLPLYIDSSVKQLPESITFLELFGVGNVEQLNVLNRWKNKDITKSLRTEIGVNENNDKFMLDLHEKQHGPHGLIAGMTGSGKSEFIITYILSMAVNYSPEEVSFVLIDYKGGGLAGAFENSELGIKLPHVVGTITNLDKAEINRALSSIKSELRRRQSAFNEVRDKIGESTIDIYKYQKLYRDGVLSEPIPHLIIVCDEFAELKDQQPDFMDDLISTARIGRSLGVHLILATQKPTGVVDSQIWSNSKFKICLKVQDKSDSMEMIKSELAAELKQVGRFYLQVGYNEYFALGQAAWAGAQYYPSKEFKKSEDRNMYFINNIGYINKTINNIASKKQVKSEGEELTNVVKYLINICKESSFKIRQLWLDRIPNKIYLKNILLKYKNYYIKEDYNINPIIGEVDDPTNQRQYVLTLPITNSGNTVIYGTTDSGKDELLSTLVYSMITTYSSDEVNIYIIDFGAETLMNYRNAPQVGDIVLNGDDEKLENIIKMLGSELNKRKKLFISYNGNYNDYINRSNVKLPNIVVIVNSIEVVNDVYMDYSDKLAPLVREGSKYGINFIFTTTNQNGIKFKIVQCCKQLLCLQLNRETDYRDLLGRTDGIVPFACTGRGLVKLEKVCEFQTASIDETDEFNKISETINELNLKGMKKARAIPVMPEILPIDRFKSKYLDLSTVPIGLTRDTLVSSLYDFSKYCVNIISSSEIDNMKRFINNFVKIVSLNNTFDKLVIDSNNFFEQFDYDINYIDNDFNSIVNELKKLDDNIQKILLENNMNIKSLKNIKNTMCVILGFEKFMAKLDDEHVSMLKNIILNQKEAAKINFVFVDLPTVYKKYEFDEWYKTCVNGMNGIWIGGNFSKQFVLKSSYQPNSYNMLENDYAIVIKNNTPVVIKLINELK